MYVCMYLCIYIYIYIFRDNLRPKSSKYKRYDMLMGRLLVLL